ncbi:MAG: DUF1189 family protein [Alphaproteobacteria bacterium]|nr:DUF1189 family protein [Alphaproteobacteria bacterium]
MQKILTYIKQAKGIGALWIFGLAVFAALYSALGAYQILPRIVPHIQNFADTFLPLKIENGAIVLPQNTVIEKTYHLNGDPIVVKLDTTQDLLDSAQSQPGIYLTRSYLYSVTDQRVQRQNLPTQLSIEKQDYTPFLNQICKHIIWLIVLIGPFFNFICFMLAVLFYAWFTSLACALNKTLIPFKVKMRLNTCLFIAVYVFSMFCSLLGINLSMFSFFLIMMALQIIYVKKVAA